MSGDERTWVGICREVSRSIERCELTCLERRPIDVTRARAQHAAYRSALARLGVRVFELAEEPDLPDAVFVEDTAVVLDELAILTRPGAASRRPELSSVEAALRGFREVDRVAAPGTVDGGDVLLVGRTLLVGRSTRTNDAGIAELRRMAEPRGYAVVPVDVAGALHLKSLVTRVNDRLLVTLEGAFDPTAFDGLELVAAHPDEPLGANVLAIDEAVLVSASAPRTAERLAARGLTVEPVENDELERAEGALTCCSLVFRA